MGILSEMRVWLSEVEMEQLYNELIAYFGLIGALDDLFPKFFLTLFPLLTLNLYHIS